jgi:PhnB protein
MSTARIEVPPVVPSFWVDAVEPVRDFYMEKLGFSHRMGIVGKDGRLDFAIVTHGGAMIMLARPTEKIEGSSERYPTKRPLEIYLQVDDVDAYHAEVTRRGVKVAQPLATQWWGDRNFGILDPHGYLLWFCQTVAEMQPPPGVKLV